MHDVFACEVFREQMYVGSDTYCMLSVCLLEVCTKDTYCKQTDRQHAEHPCMYLRVCMCISACCLSVCLQYVCVYTESNMYTLTKEEGFGLQMCVRRVPASTFEDKKRRRRRRNHES
jgi:hypothetical protein